MNKREIYIGIFILILILGGLIIVFRKTIPTEEQISLSTKNILSIDKNLFRLEKLQSIISREKNGNVPLKTDSSKIGREDPFSKY